VSLLVGVPKDREMSKIKSGRAQGGEDIGGTTFLEKKS